MLSSIQQYYIISQIKTFQLSILLTHQELRPEFIEACTVPSQTDENTRNFIEKNKLTAVAKDILERMKRKKNPS